MSLVDTIIRIEYPLLKLAGTTRPVAMADRGLQEAVLGNGPDLELERLIPALPVRKWPFLAKELVDSSGNLF